MCVCVGDVGPSIKDICTNEGEGLSGEMWRSVKRFQSRHTSTVYSIISRLQQLVAMYWGTVFHQYDNESLARCSVHAPTFESLDLETSYLVCTYIFRISRSVLYVKVIRSRSRLQLQTSGTRRHSYAWACCDLDLLTYSVCHRPRYTRELILAKLASIVIKILYSPGFWCHCLLWHWSLTFWPRKLISTSMNPNTCDQNWVKIPWLVCEIWHSEHFQDAQTHTLTDGQTRIQYTSSSIFQRWWSHKDRTHEQDTRQTHLLGGATSCLHFYL